MGQRGHETEIKLRLSSLAEARRKLRAAGFRVSKRKVFETNQLFDTPGEHLRAARKLLRVRKVAKDAKLTYKGPPEQSKHKSREELELNISDGDALIQIFDRLGYQPIFVYEKWRTEFAQPGAEGVATLDETPIGVYMELEGPPDWIDQTAQSLGYLEEDYITASYGTLYLAWCKEQGVTPANMVFG